MPTIHTGLSQRLRSALYMRSVPMLPEPMSAALIFSMSLAAGALR